MKNSKKTDTNKQNSPSNENNSEKETTYIYDKQSRTFFLTINNPIEKGLSHDEIIDIIHKKFKNVIYWCMCDEKGSKYHTHVYILLSKKKRWSACRRAFKEKAHLEESVKGSPQQCRAYIRKEGQKHKEKAETNFPETFYEEGTIPDFYVTADKTEMLLQIDDMLASGMRPDEIMEKSIVFRQYESLIRKHFFAQRKAEIDVERPLNFVYHVGASGCGKSYTYVKLVREHGEDNVYVSADYSNRATATFDFYLGEKYVVLDEVKPDSIPYGMLLTITDKYRQPIHCRYANAWSIYSELHLTSILPPEELFNSMVASSDRAKDPITQLLRRITTIVYHYKDDAGNYCTYEMTGSEYINYDDLKRRAEGTDFDKATETTPFDNVPEQLSFETIKQNKIN